jgi:hypothetical protein
MTYDLFISHASEDQDFVRPLAQELRSQGYLVWYDEFELKLGDSLSDKIDHGIANAQFGVVILSKHFFNKKWAKRELQGSVARETQEDKTILPIWHNISREEILTFLHQFQILLPLGARRGCQMSFHALNRWSNRQTVSMK